MLAGENKMASARNKEEESSLTPEEIINRRWKRWGKYLQGVAVYLTRSKHLNGLKKSEERAIEEWKRHFYIEDDTLRQQSQTIKSMKFIPIASYLECVQHISSCHIHSEGAGRLSVHLGFEETLKAALNKHIWPSAEDDVYDFFSICLSCKNLEVLKDKKKLISESNLSYKVDLPLCFKDVHKRSSMFSDEKDDEDEEDDKLIPIVQASTPPQQPPAATVTKSSFNCKEKKVSTTPLMTSAWSSCSGSKKRKANIESSLVGQQNAIPLSKNVLQPNETYTLPTANQSFSKKLFTHNVEQTSCPTRTTIATIAAESSTSEIPNTTPLVTLPLVTLPPILSKSTIEKSLKDGDTVCYLLDDIKWLSDFGRRHSPEEMDSSIFLGVIGREEIATQNGSDISFSAVTNSLFKKTNEKVRPMFDLLSKLGLSLVKESVYRDLSYSVELSCPPVATDLNKSRPSEVNHMLERWKRMRNVYDKATEHVRTPWHVCPRCVFMATSHTQLSDHLKFGKSLPVGRFDCCMCNFTTKNASSFTKHMVKDHSIPPVTYPKHWAFDGHVLRCSNCPYKEKPHVNANIFLHAEECHCHLNLDTNLSPIEIDADIPMMSVTDESKMFPVSNANSLDKPSALSPLANPEVGYPTLDETAASSSDLIGTKSGGRECLVNSSELYSHLCEICCAILESGPALERHLSVLHKIHLPHNILESKLQQTTSTTTMTSTEATTLLPFKVSKPFYSCKECDDYFWSTRGLALHEKFVHSPKALRADNPEGYCPLCKKNKLVDILSHLSKHRIFVTDMFLMKFCILCMETLNCPRAFETHMTTIHRSLFPNRPVLYSAIFSTLGGAKMSSITCDFSSILGALKSHSISATFLASLHEKIKDPEKRKRFSTLREVNDSSSDTEFDKLSLYPNEFYCVCCSCHFSNVRHLRDHFDLYHSKKCSRCNERFTSDSNRMNHFVLEHTSESELCQLCGEDVGPGPAYVDHVSSEHLKDCSIKIKKVNSPGKDSNLIRNPLNSVEQNLLTINRCDIADPIMEEDYTVEVSDLGPCCPRPPGKIPMYREVSGKWIPIEEGTEPSPKRRKMA